jgi:hypothetical protein
VRSVVWELGVAWPFCPCPPPAGTHHCIKSLAGHRRQHCMRTLRETHSIRLRLSRRVPRDRIRRDYLTQRKKLTRKKPHPKTAHSTILSFSSREKNPFFRASTKIKFRSYLHPPPSSQSSISLHHWEGLPWYTHSSSYCY